MPALPFPAGADKAADTHTEPWRYDCQNSIPHASIEPTFRSATNSKMAKKRKNKKLNAPQIFLLAALVGAVVALLIQFASNLAPTTRIPGIDDSRLVEAAAEGDANAVASLLAEGISANSRAGDNSAALHWAANLNDATMAAALIAAGADVNLTNDFGVSALWLAAENGSAEFAELLLDAKANPDLPLPSGETPLMMAARSGNDRLVQLLIDHGADLNAKEAAQQQTALMWAAAERHANVVKTLLTAGADWQARTATWNEVVQPAGAIPAIRDAIYELVQGGYTALLFAAQQGDVAVARHLLEAGADVNDRTAAGATALVLASHSGHSELARLLLEQGADPNLMGAGYSALHVAIPHRLLDLVSALIEHGADVNAVVLSPSPERRDSRDHAIREQLVGTTPFWIAAHYRQTAILQALLAAGADPSFTMPSADTLLMLAIDGRDAFFDEQTRGIVDPGAGEQQALELIDYALTMGIDINARNRNGDTALHKAAGRGYDKVVSYLAAHGAELEAANNRGLTPLANAMRLRGRGVGQSEASNETTEQLLRSLGATL